MQSPVIEECIVRLHFDLFLQEGGEQRSRRLSRRLRGVDKRQFEALWWPNKGGAIIVGDNLGSDIAGGRGYGIDTCWYNPTGRANPTDQAPTHEIRDLNELIELVGATS